MRVGLRLVSNLPQLHAHSAYLRFALRRKFACENVRTTVVERLWVLLMLVAASLLNARLRSLTVVERFLDRVFLPVWNEISDLEEDP